MEWRKVKNIIILVLLLLNGFLLVLVGTRREEALRYDQRALLQAAQVLEAIRDRYSEHLNALKAFYRRQAEVQIF